MNAIRFALYGAAAIAATVAGMSAASANPLASPATVRSGPGIQWPTIAQIPAGADVKVQGCYAGWQGGWCQVRYGKLNGYVDIATLAPSGENNVIVAPIVTNDLVNLRKGPGSNWPTLAVIPSNTPVDVAYCSQGWLYGWCKVTYEGRTGFVNGLLLQRQGALFHTPFY